MDSTTDLPSKHKASAIPVLVSSKLPSHATLIFLASFSTWTIHDGSCLRLRAQLLIGSTPLTGIPATGCGYSACPLEAGDEYVPCCALDRYCCCWLSCLLSSTGWPCATGGCAAAQARSRSSAVSPAGIAGKSGMLPTPMTVNFSAFRSPTGLLTRQGTTE